MKTRSLAVIGIFLMIFGIDGVLLVDSSTSQCMGFTGMALFVFVTLGFDSRAILSNPDCFESFFGQIVSSILFTIGLGIMINTIIKKRKHKIQNNQRNILA